LSAQIKRLLTYVSLVTILVIRSEELLAMLDDINFLYTDPCLKTPLGSGFSIQIAEKLESIENCDGQCVFVLSSGPYKSRSGNAQR
jgi:hypothetical protein